MKSSFLRLIAFLVLLCSAYHSWGVGEIYFRNNPITSTRISTNYNGTTGFISGAGNYYFALFQAPPDVSIVSSPVFQDANWTFTGAYATNTIAIGQFFAANPTEWNTTYVSGTPGSAASFVVIGWSVNIGTTVEDLQQWFKSGGGPTIGPAFWGQSQVGTVLLGGDGLSAPQLFGNSPGQLSGFTLQAIPEPSSFAIMGMGVTVSVIILRRQRIG